MNKELDRQMGIPMRERERVSTRPRPWGCRLSPLQGLPRQKKGKGPLEAAGRADAQGPFCREADLCM